MAMTDEVRSLILRRAPSHEVRAVAVLRLYVAGRSCCSYFYGLAFDEKATDADAVSEVSGLRVAIDPESRPYCDGAKIEWVDGPEGTGFLVRNPSMSGTCGCSG